MSNRKRYLVGLTATERDFIVAVIHYFDGAGERTTSPAELTMHKRLLNKLDTAVYVTEGQVNCYERAAGNLLDDPECVRDHRLEPAFRARDALRKVMS